MQALLAESPGGVHHCSCPGGLSLTCPGKDAQQLTTSAALASAGPALPQLGAPRKGGVRKGGSAPTCWAKGGRLRGLLPCICPAALGPGVLILLQKGFLVQGGFLNPLGNPKEMPAFDLDSWVECIPPPIPVGFIQCLTPPAPPFLAGIAPDPKTFFFFFIDLVASVHRRVFQMRFFKIGDL